TNRYNSSLHDALPILPRAGRSIARDGAQLRACTDIADGERGDLCTEACSQRQAHDLRHRLQPRPAGPVDTIVLSRSGRTASRARSEEHTSELQSLAYI